MKIKIQIMVDHGGLKKNRKLSGMSIEELAKKTGLDPEMLRQYEDGSLDLNKASLLTLLTLCNALEVELSTLLTDEETIKAWEKYIKTHYDEDDDDEDDEEEDDADDDNDVAREKIEYKFESQPGDDISVDEILDNLKNIDKLKDFIQNLIKKQKE